MRIQLKFWHKILLTLFCFSIAIYGFILKLPSAFRGYDKELHTAFYFFAAAFLNILFAKRNIFIHLLIFGLLYVFGMAIEHGQVLSKKLWHIPHGRYDPEDVFSNLKGLLLFSAVWLVFTGIALLTRKPPPKKISTVKDIDQPTPVPKVNAYITFNGNCEEAFNFYKSVFGGEFLYIGRYKDVPATDRQIFQEEKDEKIMHVSLPIGKETILQGCDNSATSEEAIISSSNISLSININNKSEADRLFNELSAGGKIKMSMAETFWGVYFGMFTDKFGINWMINADNTTA